MDAVAVRKLPAIFVSYYTLVLQPILVASSESPRNERVARTICEVLDWLLRGEPLEAIVVLLGFLRTIEGAATPEGSGRNVAQHHELIPPSRSETRETAARDPFIG